jgi:hypothetical protein
VLPASSGFPASHPLRHGADSSPPIRSFRAESETGFNSMKRKHDGIGIDHSAARLDGSLHQYE